MSRRSSPLDQLGGTLQRVVQRFDPDQRLDVYRVWVFWDEEVGETIAQRAQPLSFRRGVLSVRVNSHPWLQELQFMKQTIRDKLNARLGAEMIRDIYFVFDSTHEPPPAPARDEPAAREVIPPEPLPAIRDPQLGEVFTRLVRAHATHRPRTTS